jgi:hypothetical protein
LSQSFKQIDPLTTDLLGGEILVTKNDNRYQKWSDEAFQAWIDLDAAAAAEALLGT